MNLLELYKIFNKMIEKTEIACISLDVSVIKDAIVIDKKEKK